MTDEEIVKWAMDTLGKEVVKEEFMDDDWEWREHTTMNPTGLCKAFTPPTSLNMTKEEWEKGEL